MPRARPSRFTSRPESSENGLVLSALLVLALTRAEIVERFKAPVITQADGLVQVHADCPEDMRKEFQKPVARFAADTVQTLYQGLAKKPLRFSRAEIVIHIGDVRTNLTEVTTQVSTNEGSVVSRIILRAPGSADLDRFRLELIKAFYRSVEKREISEAEAVAAYRHAIPDLRIFDERLKLEDWLAGRGTRDDEEGLRLMRKIFKPGESSPRDVLTFASRLYLYPPQYDLRFLGKFDRLSFSEAARFGRIDPIVRLVAYYRALDLPVMGGGRSPELTAAANAYQVFLFELAKGEMGEKGLRALLDEADEKLNVAFEKAVRQ